MTEKLERDKTILIRVADSEKEKLNYVAQARGTTGSEVLRKAIEREYLKVLLKEYMDKSATYPQPLASQWFLEAIAMLSGDVDELAFIQRVMKTSLEAMITQEMAKYFEAEKARPAATGGSQPGEGTTCTIATPDSNKGQTNETEKT